MASSISFSASSSDEIAEYLATTTNGVTGDVASTSNSDFAKKVKDAISTTLSTPAGHVTKILVGGSQLGSNAVTGVVQYPASSVVDGASIPSLAIASATTTAIAAFASTPALGKALNAIFNNSATSKYLTPIASAINCLTDTLKDPNIEGIPIHAIQETESQAIDVCKTVTIVQSASNKSVVVDNATPQLREWTIKGYLMSIPAGIDTYLVIKPSLMLQAKMLKQYANTRRPVWFKTHDNRFYTVLISNIETSYSPNALNAMDITLRLTEFRVLDIQSTNLASIVATKQASKEEL